MCTNQTHWMDIINDLFTVSCGVTSVILNTIVLVIALRYVDFHVKLSQVYVVNMTVSDLIYALAYMSTKPLVGCFPSWLCACYYILVWSSQIGSVFFLLFLNIDKFISLSAPLHYHMYVTERRVRWLWLSFWAIPLSHSIFTYFGPWMIPGPPSIPCRIGLHPIYYASTIIVFYIIPLTISAMISVYIYLLAVKKTRWTAPANDCQASNNERKRARKQLVKRVFFVFSSTLWSTITILPYRLAFCIYMFACVSVGPSSTGDSILPANISTNSSISFSSTLSIDASSTLTADSTAFNSTMNSVLADEVTGGGGTCKSEWVSVLIYVLFCLPPLGAVGNPLITIVTQRFYRTRAAQIWTSATRLLHLPARCSSCKRCARPIANSNETGDTTMIDYETYGVGKSSSMVVRGGGSGGGGVKSMLVKENGAAGVPLLGRQNLREDTVPERSSNCSSRAFQVL